MELFQINAIPSIVENLVRQFLRIRSGDKSTKQSKILWFSLISRWIDESPLEREGGGFFFLDGSSRHRAIFPSLCAAGILRDKSDKSIRHAELTYDPSPPRGAASAYT